MKRMIGLLMMVGVIVGCGSSDNYRLFVYPNRNDLTVSAVSREIRREFGPYDSVEEARDVAKVQVANYPNGDYEIGKNCERKSYTSPWKCEDTFQSTDGTGTSTGTGTGKGENGN